jgi:hypothetical protein
MIRIYGDRDFCSIIWGKSEMNIFDKICTGITFLLGLVFLVLGAFGLFKGCNAHFSLPPIWGIIPAFFGWGIIRSVLGAWKPPQ